MPGISFYPEGTQVLPSDDSNRTLHKIAALSGAGSGGSVGTGGTAGQQVYQDRAPNPPDNTAIPAVSYDAATGSLQHWIVSSQSWV